MELSWEIILIIILGSGLAGCINTLAGNGSAITLTILTELIGLPGNIANGTNRIGIFTQSLFGVWAFHKNGKLSIRRSRLPIILATAGAIAGVIVAVNISNEAFKNVFRFLMVVMLFVILVKPKRWLRDTDTEYKPNPWLAIPLYLGIGFYGGFIQMGMGIFFLAIMVLFARYNLIEANALKIVVISIYTIIVIGIFQSQGLIDWRAGALMAVGQSTGGYLTAHYASKYEQANVWAHRLLIVVVVLAILKLFNVHTLLW